MNQHIGTKGLVKDYDKVQEAAVVHLLWRLKRDSGKNLLQNVKMYEGLQ